MKRYLALVVSLCLVFAMLPFAASAGSAEVARGTCGDNLTWVLTEDGTLTISGNGYMDELYMEEENVIYCPWGTLQDQVRRVVVKPGVRSIGSAAFYRHSNLTSVSLPEGLESIGWSAFYDCPNLTSVYLSEGLLHIGDHAFAYCEALPTLSIPDGTLTIGKEALYNCYSLTTLDVPDSVTAIGDYAFMGCLGVTDLNIPDAITRIGDYTYACCGITSAEIPEGVTEIGEYAFWGCEQMEQLMIPNTVTRIGSNAFRACVSLVSVTIPDSVERIESEAFAICEGLEEINLGNGITSIETRAFYDCVKLQSVTFPKSLTYLADHAFEWCPSLKTITFQGSAPEVGEEPVMPYASITIFFPANDPTWTEAEMQKYGENKTWVSHDVPSAYTVKWSSISTSLGGNIAMNFYVELSENLVSDPNAYVQFSFAGRTIQVSLSEGKPSDKNGVTVYQFSCPITSKNMTDEITAQVYNADGAVGEPKSMSVDTYCNWVIANFKDEKTVNLMKGMLNYGASAQKLFNYRTDDLANATLAEEDKVFGAVDASAYKHSVTGTEEGIIAKSMTLLLDSETTVRVYFELTGDKTIDQYTFTVDGVEVTPKFKDGKYYIERPNISAHRLDDMHVFTCGGITVTYGGLSYVNQVMTYYKSGTTFEMASALYAYSKAAEEYIVASAPAEPPVTDVKLSLDQDYIEMGTGETATIQATYSGATGVPSWSSDNTSVARVDGNGQVTAVGEGVAILTASYGGKAAYCVVSVYEKIEETEPELGPADRMILSGNNGSWEVGCVGNSLTFSVWVKTVNDYNIYSTATSSNPNVATVSTTNKYGSDTRVTVSYVGAGSTTITLTSEDGMVSTSFTINVKEYTPPGG